MSSKVTAHLDHSPYAWLLAPSTLVVVALISLVGLAFWSPLFDLDEGAFSEATREMLASGNWVSTYLNGVPRYDKPILIYWFQAVSATLFGINSFAFRLPSLLAAGLWLLVIYRFVKEFFNTRAAALTVWIMVTTTLVSVMAKAATADALLNLLLTTTFFQIYRFWSQTCAAQEGGQALNSWPALAIIGGLMGLGFLTKGPVAVVLPLATALAAMTWRRDIKIWLLACLHPASWLTFLVVIIPWHIAVYLDQGWDFFRGFYLGHNLERFSSTMESHGGNPAYYLLLLPFLLLPYTRQAVKLLPQLRTLSWRAPEPITLYFGFWFLITFTIFSFSQTQLPHYLLYGLVPVFIAMAVQWSKSAESVNRWDLVIAFISAVLICALPLALKPLADKAEGYDSATAALGWAAFASHYWLVALALLLAAVIVLSRNAHSSARLLILAGLVVAASNFVLMPTIVAGQQQPVYELASIARTLAPEQRLVAYKVNMPSFSVYSRRVVPRDDPQPGDTIFLRIDKLAGLQQAFPQAQLQLIAQSGGIALYRWEY
ncbi:ArnT family glycosyltransferase [Halioxenophilus sp. WMMB6]|uniref:ArnT family glycosyltransferase n=1 Tax=Halioxenophilus sp. WMMB6 TaxID=3073815 RepID=UPI00295F0C27|nr:glycosyltransferase family 39 protein [Halioxenophilus sp. WMMB6]